MLHKQVSICRVDAPEHKGGCGHGGRGLSQEVGTGVCGVNLPRIPRRGHVLWSLPAFFVDLAVSDMAIEQVRLRVAIEEVVCAPFDGLSDVVKSFQFANRVSYSMHSMREG